MADAFGTSVASNLVSKLGEYLFAPIGRQFGYVLCYKCYVEDLENGVKKLENATKRVQSSVDEAISNGKPIHSDVKDWLGSAKKKAKEAENLLKRGESAQNTCFRGWLPNPVVRHLIGRKVKKITKVIQDLFMKSESTKFQKVYHENPPIGIIAANPLTARSVNNREAVLESRAKITEDVLKAIVDDKVCVIGVWGAGGVGKSKLLEDVERRVKEENLFDVVATATISHTPNLKDIQRAIACALGLKLTNDELADERAHRLRKRIEDDSKKNMREDDSKKKKNMREYDSKKNMIEDDSKKNMIEDDSKKNILIILDDLWEKLELKKVGIPCSDGNKVRGCKLLLTSRKLDVLRIDMGSDQEFQLNVLEYGEARRLFERTIEYKVNSSEFEPWVDGVVKNCGGMPLSIVPLARMLKHKDLAAWKDASTNRDLSNVKSVVELSYNDIKEERIRSLFLVCALTFGRISVRDSLIYCIGLGLYKMFSETIQSARYKLIVDLHSLRDSSLLLDNDAKELFIMHDIFVEVAISIASMEWNALVGRKGYGFKEMSEEERRKCTVISFPYVGIDELPAKLDCPNLKMLLIFEHNQSLEIPELFFESMGKLQVLDLTGLYITTLPLSTEFLENLQSLSLDQCHLEDVTILGKLKGLQFLSFTGSTIARLPIEIGELTRLRFLDLKGCDRLQIIDPGMLKSLVNLEELYIDKFCQWEAEDEAPRSNASLAELKNMKKLSALYITIPQSTDISSDLPFGNLNEHKIRIGGIGKWWGEYKQSRTLKLKLDSSNLLHEVWMQECLRRTQDLRLNGLQDGRDSIHDLCIKGFQELKHLHVKNNLSFHCIAESAKCPAFTKLESLVLKKFEKLGEDLS